MSRKTSSSDTSISDKRLCTAFPSSSALIGSVLDLEQRAQVFQLGPGRCIGPGVRQTATERIAVDLTAGPQTNYQLASSWRMLASPLWPLARHLIDMNPAPAFTTQRGLGPRQPDEPASVARNRHSRKDY